MPLNLKDDLGILEKKGGLGLTDDLGIFGERAPGIYAAPKREPEPKEGYTPTQQDITLLQQNKLPKGFQEIGYTESDIPEIKKQLIYTIEPSKRAIESKQYELFTDRMVKQVYGEDELEEIATGQRRLNKFMRVAWRIPTYAVAGPVAALTFEGLDQARNILHAKVKGEKYDPTERRMLSELLPETIDPKIRIGASLVEYGGEIALVSKLMNMATAGTLKGALKEVGGKLEKAGYGTAKVTISEDVIKDAARGTRLEKAIKTWWKAKKFKAKIPTERRIGAPPKPVAPPPKVPVTPSPIMPTVPKITPEVPKAPITPTPAPIVPPLKPEVAKTPIVEGGIPDNVITKVRDDGFIRGTIEEKKQTAKNLFNFLEEGDVVERDRMVTEKDASGNYVEKKVTDTGVVVIEDGRKIIKGKIAGGFEKSKKGLELDTGQPFNLFEGDRVIKAKEPKLSPKEGGGIMVYIGKQEGKPQGKYIYGAESKEYAKNFGEQVSEQKITPQNIFDLTPLKETSISFDKLSKTLKEKDIYIDKSIVGDDDVYKPAWQWIRKYPAIADKIKEAGFDSIKQLETFTGKGKKELTYQVLDNKILSPKPTKKVKEVPAPKGKVTILPQKQQLLKQIDEAIKKAPDKVVDDTTKDKIPKITFEIDGGAEIYNTKQSLTEFRDRIKKLPEKETLGPRKPTTYTGLNARKEDLDKLVPLSIKGWFSDGKLLIKGEAPSKAKIDSERPPITKETLDKIIETKTIPAKKLYYSFSDALTGDEGVSPEPVPFRVSESATPLAIFESDGKYFTYNQYKLNAIDKRYPNATFGIEQPIPKINKQGGTLVAYEDGEKVAFLLPMAHGGVVKGQAYSNIPPNRDMAVEAGLLPEPVKKVPEPTKKQPSIPGLGKPEDLGAPKKLRGIDAFEGVQDSPEQVELRLFEETKKIAKKYANIIGEKYVPKGLAGIQWGDTKNIFVRALNDISTTIHEVVHYVDTKQGIFRNIMRKVGESKTGNPIYAPETKAIRKELTRAYMEYVPLGKKTHKLVKRVREGLAEFIENYVAQPTATKEKYPLLYKEFMEGGDYYDPLIPALVKDARNLIGAYQKLDPLKKVGAKVLSDDQPIKQSFMKFHEKVIQEIVDNIYPLEKIAKEAGVRWTAKDPSLWTRLYNNLAGIISRNIDTNKGYVHFKNEELKKLYDYNWKTLIEELKKDKLTDDFAYWLVARREFFAYEKLDKMGEDVKQAAEEMKFLKEKGLLDTVQGQRDMQEAKKVMDDYKRLADILRKDGFSRPVITDAYNQYKDQFIKQVEQFDNLVRADLDFLRDTGVVSEKNYQEFIENEGYATFKRDVYNEVIGEGQEVRGVVRTGKRVSSLKGRTGSQLTIINPIYSSIKNHAEIMKKGIKQLILNKIYDLKHYFPEFMQETKLIKAPRPGGGFTYPQDKDPNIIMAMVNGQRKPLLVSKEIKTVIDELLNWKNMHIFEGLLIKFSRMFTKGTTGLYPPFAIQNFFVDQITATAQTTTQYKPVIDQLNLLYKQLHGHGKQAEYLKEYLMLGGQRHTFVGWLDMTPNEYFKAISKEKTIIKKVGDMLEQGAQLIGTPTQFSEILTRAVEYIKAREMGLHQVVALERAGRVSAPFHHVGKWGGQTAGRTLIKSIPYFNASLQVLAQFTRTLKSPKTRKRAVFVVMALTASIIGGFMAILKKGTEKQKRIYRELHPRELAHYIFFPAPNGEKLLRLRVPEQMSAIATLINMGLADALMDTRYSKKEYIDAVTAWVPDQFNVTDPVRQFFSWMPHAIGPVTEVLMNKRTYPKVMPIEGMSMENHEKRMRYNKHTGWLAKYIGKHLNLSPIKIDYLIEQMIGRTSKFVKGGRITNPVVREEYFNSGRRLVEFYELRKATNQKYNSLKNNLRDFTPQEREEVLRLRQEIKIVSGMLQIYNVISENKEKTLETEKLKKDILDRIDSFKYTK